MPVFNKYSDLGFFVTIMDGIWLLIPLLTFNYTPYGTLITIRIQIGRHDSQHT